VHCHCTSDVAKRAFEAMMRTIDAGKIEAAVRRLA
jgi:hypothetical protein